jgi:hypothetical protein
MLMGFPYCCLICTQNREFQLFGGTGAQVSSMCGTGFIAEGMFGSQDVGSSSFPCRPVPGIEKRNSCFKMCLDWKSQ